MVQNDIFYIASDGGLAIYNDISGELEHLTKSDGLPSNAVEDVEFDQDGNLWIGTYDNGLAMKTGQSWEQITIPEAGFLYCIHFDQSGVLWVGAELGVFKRDGTQWIHYAAPAWDIVETPDGTVWAASIQPFRPGIDELPSFEEPLEGGCPVSAYQTGRIGYTKDGDILFANGNSELARLSDGEWIIEDLQDLTEFTPSITDIFSSQEQALIYVSGEGIIKFEDGEWTDITVPALSTPSYKEAVTLTNDGRLVVARRGELTIQTGDTFRSIDIRSFGLQFNNDINFIELANGQVGIYSDTHYTEPLRFIDPNTLETKPTDLANFDFHDNNHVLINDESGNRTAYLDRNSGIIHFTDHAQQLYSPQVYIALTACYHGLIDSAGNYWFATPSGLYKITSSDILLFDNNNTEFVTNKFAHLKEDPSGRIWAISAPVDDYYHFNLGIYEDGNWTFFPGTENPMIDQRITNLDFDEEGILWYGSNNTGLFSFDGETWTNYNTSNSNIPTTHLYDVACANGKLYIASTSGFLIAEDGQFTSYDSSNSPMTFDYPANLVVDVNENIWVQPQSYLKGGILYKENEVAMPVGLQEIEQDDLFDFYPNPAAVQITLKLDSPGSYQITLRDASGRIVLDFNNDLCSQLSIPLYNFASGIYYLSLSDHERTRTKQLIKF